MKYNLVTLYNIVTSVLRSSLMHSHLFVSLYVAYSEIPQKYTCVHDKKIALLQWKL